VPVATTFSGITCHFEERFPSVPDGVLAVISHADSSSEPSLHMGLPALGISVPGAGGPGPVEVWRTGRGTVSGASDGMVYAHDGHYLFCGGRVPHDENYAMAVERLYLRALDLIQRTGYPGIARMWNVVGGITTLRAEEPAGINRYGEFCQARGRAFSRRGLAAGEMPAATGIGGQDGYTTVYLLATRSTDIVRIENPRQVPAFEYPDRYGPQAPSFARAAWVRPGHDGADLFVSGTASIVGHETVHPGDVRMQTRTTLENIAELVSGENLRRHGITAAFRLRDLDCVKVYVKRAGDVAAVRQICTSLLDPGSQVEYTVTDVCRDDLLVEIEAFASVRVQWPRDVIRRNP
jgi:chorismatase